MRFSQCVVGQILVSGANNHYEVIAVHDDIEAVDLKCVFDKDDARLIGRLHLGWKHLSTFRVLHHSLESLERMVESLKVAHREETSERIRLERELEFMIKRAEDRLRQIQEQNATIRDLTLERDKAQAKLYRLSQEK